MMECYKCRRQVHVMGMLLISLQVISTIFLSHYLSLDLSDTNEVLFDASKEQIFSPANSFAESFASVRLQQVRDAIVSLGASWRIEGQNVTGATSMLEHTMYSKLARSNRPVLRSCFGYHTSQSGNQIHVRWRKDCGAFLEPNNQTLLVFNSLKVARLMCGKRISPLGVAQINPRDCKGSSIAALLWPLSIFEDRTIRVVRAGSEKGNHAMMRKVDCDVPCQYPTGTMGIVSTLKIAGTDWTIIHSMEGSHYYKSIAIDSKAYLHEKYYSTTSFKSEIPLPYFSFAEYDIKSKPVNFEKVIHGASFLAKNCHSRSRREDWVRGLQKYIRIDSLSSCLHNSDPPNGLDLKDKVKVMGQYLFHLAFENGILEDYITEKLWGPLEAGTVPVYLGAPNVNEHAPQGSIISAHDFSSLKELGEYLAKVAGNRTLYEQYHKWRSSPYPKKFLKKYNITRTHSECRTCRWAYAKKFGLAWDHERQNIIQPYQPTTVCTKSGFSLTPFEEVWRSGKSISRGMKGGSLHDCGKDKILRASIGDYMVRRYLLNHDNLFDMTIHVTKGGSFNVLPLHVRFVTTIENNGLYASAPSFFVAQNATPWFPEEQMGNDVKVIFIQDSHMRMTVFTDWRTSLTCGEDGAVDILIHDGSTSIEKGEIILRRIRILVEKQDKLHFNKKYATPSFFSKIVASEINNPVEVFSLECKIPEDCIL